jgi:hypothetical protein
MQQVLDAGAETIGRVHRVQDGIRIGTNRVHAISEEYVT